MILSDGEIRRALIAGEIIIKPWTSKQIQPASYDVAISSHLWIPDSKRRVDLANQGIRREGDVEGNRIEFTDHFLAPGDFVLGSIEEWVEVPNNMVARLEGKSSLGRLGLLVHVTAGYVDPGFKGHLTLELLNVSRRPIILRPHILIAQITFLRLNIPAEHPYGSPGLGSRFQNQGKEPVAVRVE